jgi:hypothetical protein
VDHVIAPLDRDHARVVTELAVDHRRAGDRSGGRYGMFAGDDDIALSLQVMVYAPERSTGSTTP